MRAGRSLVNDVPSTIRRLQTARRVLRSFRWPSRSVPPTRAVRRGSLVHRRTFLRTVVGSLLAAPLAVEAQQAGKVPKLGYLSNSSSEEAADRAFMQALRDLGWVDGQTIIVEARYTAGNSERPPEFVRDFIGREIDIIVAWSPFAVAAAKRGTITVPIVGLSMGDPVAAGVVVSLARPGANVTGLADLQKELHAKRIALLKETVPGIRRLAVLSNPAHPNVVESLQRDQSAAR